MSARSLGVLFATALGLAWPASNGPAQVTNLKVVTDASPDYSDMESLVHSIFDLRIALPSG